MTAFELIYLHQMKLDAALMNTSLWMGITFAVVVAGYAAGKWMTKAMLGMLVVIYTVYTILNRYGFYLLGMQMRGIIRDIEDLRASGQGDLNSLAAIPGLDGPSIAFGASFLILSVLVWAGAIYFLINIRRQ